MTHYPSSDTRTIISILGCGWYGHALAITLVSKGYRVKGSTTSSKKLASLRQDGIEAFLINLQENNLAPEQDSFFDCDVLIIACNVSLNNRPNYQTEIQQLISHLRGREIKKVIFISSTSVYGEPNAMIDEQSKVSPVTASARLLWEAEEMLLAEEQSFEVTVLRFGGLFGPGRLPGRFLSGKKDIPNGLAPVNLIHLTDCIGLTEAIIISTKPVKCLNGVHPDHPTRHDFYRAAAEAEHLTLPEFTLQLNDWKIVRSQYGPDFYRYQSPVLTP